MDSKVIKRIDAVKVYNMTRPMLYFEPSLEEREIMRNATPVQIEVIDNDIYKGKIHGVVVTSCNYPNPRPNYSEKTGQWMIILDHPWVEYPNHLGKFKFITEKDKDHREKYSKKKPTESKKKHSAGCGCSNTKGLNMAEIILTIVVLVVIIVVVVVATLV